jgi:capsular polysaccharide biosynthesis protein
MTLLELFQLLRKHLTFVIVLPIVCALVTGIVSLVALPDEYTASVSLYVLNKSSSSTDSGSLSNTDLSASQMLTNDVVTLIQSDRVESDTASALGMTSLDGYDINIDSSSSTRVITVSVTGTSAQSVALVANQLASTTDSIARQVMDVESINVIDEATAPSSPSGPPRAMYTIVAFFIGLLAAIVIVVIVDMANTRVRSAEEASELLDNIPVIGRIPVLKM